jgi:hypothetical protein
MGAVSYPLRMFVQRTISRMKSWYEIMKGASKSEELAVLEAMRADTKWILESQATSAFLRRSTGDKHLDSELAKILSMTGMMNLRELWERSDTITIYETVQRRSANGRYRGDARAFVKRGGTSALCTYSEADRHMTAYSTDTFVELCANLPSRWRPDTVLHRVGRINPDSLDCTSVQVLDGNRVMVFSDEMGLMEYYVQIPWVSPYAETHSVSNPNHSDWINGWLCRRPVTKVSIDDLIDQLSTQGLESDLCSASVSFAGSLAARKSLTQIEERIGNEKKTAVQRPAEFDWDSYANEIVSALPQGDIEDDLETHAEMYVDLIADLIDTNYDTHDYAFMAEPIDYYNHSVSLNATFRKLNEMVEQLRLVMDHLPFGLKTVVLTYVEAMREAINESSESDSD